MKAALILLCSVFVLSSVGCMSKSIYLKEVKVLRDDGTSLEIGELSLQNFETQDLYDIFQCKEVE